MRNTKPPSPTPARTVRLQDLPLAELQAALLDTWQPTRLPISSVARGLGAGTLSAPVILSGEWRPVITITISLVGQRPVALGAQLGEVSLPQNTSAQFAFGVDGDTPYFQGPYGQARCTQTGPLHIADVLNGAWNARAGEHTIHLLGRAVGTSGAVLVQGHYGRAWAYEL